MDCNNCTRLKKLQEENLRLLNMIGDTEENFVLPDLPDPTKRKGAIPFINFWNLYDKKMCRPKTEKKWNSLPVKIQQKIMDYLPGYIVSTPDKKYRKFPMTFLNNESWEDELMNFGNSMKDAALGEYTDVSEDELDTTQSLLEKLGG